MTGASLAWILVVALGQVAGDDPAELVARLGAPRYSQREAASAALERLGRGALPALRSARGVKDPEVRSRVAGLLVRIEGAILTQPTTVRLKFKDAPLGEVLKSVSEQAGVKLVLQPENGPAFRGRKVTLVRDEPVPFWKALDLLADAARLQYNYGPHGFPAGREPVFPLFDGGARPMLPSFDDGPFRVNLIGLHYQRDVNFTGAQNLNGMRFAPNPNVPPAPAPASPYPAVIQENCNAQIQVVGEPRLVLGQSGMLKVTEAVDDKGHSLAIPADPSAGANGDAFQRSAGYFGYSNGSTLQVQAQLVRPTSPGSTIKVLKGVLPVTVSTRKPDPLVVPLKAVEGRTFQNEDVVLTVHSVRAVPESRQTNIEVSVRPQTRGTPAAPTAPGAEIPAFNNRPDGLQQQIDVVDNLGRPIPWYPANFDGETGRITLALTTGDVVTTPAELRYFGIARATTNVSFEFHDLPLP